MNKRHYEHTLPNIRGSLSNTYDSNPYKNMKLDMDALKQYNRFIYPLSLFLDRIL